jgi:hypothetical protein
MAFALEKNVKERDNFLLDLLLATRNTRANDVFDSTPQKRLDGKTPCDPQSREFHFDPHCRSRSRSRRAMKLSRIESRGNVFGMARALELRTVPFTVVRYFMLDLADVRPIVSNFTLQ